MSSSAPRSPEDQLELALASLEHGAKKRRSGFHHGVLATLAPTGPAARTLILRGLEREPLAIRFHCDSRSQKLNEIVENPKAEACFYSPADRLQIRLAGELTCFTEGEIVEKAWEETQLLSKRVYLAGQAPGTQLDDPSQALPDHLRDREPTEEESLPGRQNFAVLVLKATKLDVMELHISGHIRSRHTLEPTGWNSIWTQP
jgi:pyridoxamine 5'-phosphate oxidase